MKVERAQFVAELDKFANDPEHADVETCSILFALYEKELFDQIRFLRERLGDLSVAYNIDIARELAADTIRESEYRWD